MFDNIGSKIKTLAQVICWIGIIASIIIGFVLMVQDEDTVFIGILTMILGSLGSWTGSFITYGFGQLIENSDILVKQGNKIPEKQSNTSSNAFVHFVETPKHQWRCDGCGNMISENICPICNKVSKEMSDKLETLNKWKAEGLITDEEYQQKVESLK